MLPSNNVSEKQQSQAKPGMNENTEQSQAFKKVAEEMESLFAYQLIKTMRQTANSFSDEKKSSGHDTYMSMFDMEISKLFAKRGMGLQKSILNWLERMPGPVNSITDIKK
jgi:Rod binding domain-containing protein